MLIAQDKQAQDLNSFHVHLELNVDAQIQLWNVLLRLLFLHVLIHQTESLLMIALDIDGIALISPMVQLQTALQEFHAILMDLEPEDIVFGMQIPMMEFVLKISLVVELNLVMLILIVDLEDLALSIHVVELKDFVLQIAKLKIDLC